MKFLEVILYLSAATLWIFLIGGWNSVYIQRLLATFLLARADSIDSQRKVMRENYSSWKGKVGIL